MAERPYRWVRVKSFANLTLQRIVDKPFMQEFLFLDICTNLNEEAAEIKLCLNVCRPRIIINLNAHV